MNRSQFTLWFSSIVRWDFWAFLRQQEFVNSFCPDTLLIPHTYSRLIVWAIHICYHSDRGALFRVAVERLSWDIGFRVCVVWAPLYLDHRGIGVKIDGSLYSITIAEVDGWAWSLHVIRFFGKHFGFRFVHVNLRTGSFFQEFWRFFVVILWFGWVCAIYVSRV